MRVFHRIFGLAALVALLTVGLAHAQPVILPPTISKAFTKSVIDINEVTAMTFTITNPNATPLTGVAFTDALPAGIQAVLALGVFSDCPTSTLGGTISTYNVSGTTVAGNSSCVVGTNVIGVVSGAYTNTTSTVTSVESGPGLAASAPITVLPIVDGAGIYQLRYLANLDKGDSYVNFTNAGTLSGFDPAGRICVNVYTFDPAEELISCCACPVTPNGLNSLSARNDLISNTLTPGVPTSITVKLLATVPSNGVCNASAPTAVTTVRGMRAWATTLHLNTSGSPAVGYQATETPFTNAELSVTELTKLTSFCGFIQANGSGFGICKSCRNGSLGASQQ